MEQHVWRVRSGRVTVLGRDGREHTYGPRDEFVCDERQLAWRREQVEHLRPHEDPAARTAEAPDDEEPPGDAGEKAPDDAAAGPDPEQVRHRVESRGGGWYDVMDEQGNRLNDEALRYPDARALAGEE